LASLLLLLLRSKTKNPFKKTPFIYSSTKLYVFNRTFHATLLSILCRRLQQHTFIALVATTKAPSHQYHTYLIYSLIHYIIIRPFIIKKVSLIKSTIFFTVLLRPSVHPYVQKDVQTID
jgi:hypothetical protein